MNTTPHITRGRRVTRMLLAGASLVAATCVFAPTLNVAAAEPATAVVEQDSVDIIGAVPRVEALLNEIRKTFAELAPVWGGTESSEFTALTNRWDANAAQYMTHLRMLAQVVDSMNQDLPPMFPFATTDIPLYKFDRLVQDFYGEDASIIGAGTELSSGWGGQAGAAAKQALDGMRETGRAISRHLDELIRDVRQYGVEYG